MKKIFLTVCLSIVSFLTIAQKADNRIVIGTVDTIQSKVLNEKRLLLIHVPEGAKSGRFPVLYILDGESHFYSAVGIVNQMAGVIPDMIIVGITNTVRDRDLTPTAVKDKNPSGGGENFLGFIQKELIPYVDSKYPTAPYRIFSGHSLGGLTVMNAFLTHGNLFNAYIAIDPSLWWDDQRWIKKCENELPNRSFNNKSLFVAIANNIPPGLDTVSVMNDKSEMSLIPRAVLPFVAALRKTRPPGLRWASKFYPDERHGTVELIAEYDALRYLFNYYQFRTSQFNGHPELNPDSVLTAHFKTISAHFGYTVKPTEDIVNSLAYSVWGSGNAGQAYKLFKRNTEEYPQSGNAFDSLGDFYSGTGQKQKAIEAYTHSLKLQETADTRRKLNELNGQR
ncbi:alpha/beta hydrolase-fold protein [Mucilaginibacter sp. L3T2-6]|uniref:alpha/beta hydrolase-fold protein n=1 Tax=Mucilaginibacter sp. L3T2-6 TaxID=3062491 RepID=UPI0026771D89|nr:alpha/beta hydrolase-fold protein [Mucilaginibacter sp. L3T2-6]MDO3640524.1 alpha/beta hydrolase-fold protein [Mucilaginibacter sp. L3T2-6]MDV6213137.1 alpha/beta hydrolase-fold protein [Mucilaginibacter sp. L3T2-6]